MRAAYCLPFVMLLVACGTPQEQCIRRETKDLRTLERLITVTEGNLQRGYALQEVPITRERWETCYRSAIAVPQADGTIVTVPQPYMCRRDYTEFETRPKAIDLKVEADKLKTMQQKRRSLITAANASVAQCKSLHPE